MKFVAGNAQDIGARPQQQDAFGFSDPGDPKFVAHAGFLGVVADGMGGLTHGSDASRSAVHAFLSAYTRKSAGESIPKALTRCLGEANLGVLRVAQNVPPGDEVGTTLVAAVLHDHTLYWVSVGDSRIYLLHGSTLTQLTADHVYARELNHQVAEGRITLRDALVHPERSSLTSYLGQVEPAHVDKNVRPLHVNNDDCVMLCSDGFYRALTDQELVTAFRTPPQAACDTLVRKALAKQRKQQDNLTVIALRSHTRAPLPRYVKIASGIAAMLLIAVCAGVGYWIRKPTLTLSIRFSLPVPPPCALDKKNPPPSQPDNQGTCGQNVRVPPKPPANPPQHANSNQSKKKDTGGKGSKPPTNGTKPQATGTAPAGQSSQQQPPTGTPDGGKPPDQSGAAPSGNSDQNKTTPIQPPGAEPLAPTAPATPPQPNDNKKKDTDAHPGKDDEAKPQPDTPKDNPTTTPQPPNARVLEGSAPIKG
jgi:PPM family protein phosphatase